MCSGTRSAIIVLALPQCHCGCSEASVLRRHMTEVCSGSSKVPLQHGQDPPLAPVSVRHIATVMVLMIEIAKLRNTCHVDFLAIQKTCSLVCAQLCFATACALQHCFCTCFAAMLLYLICSNSMCFAEHV